jgi:hypothetical protein
MSAPRKSNIRIPENLQIIMDTLENKDGFVMQIHSNLWAIFKKRAENLDEYGFQLLDPNNDSRGEATWGMTHAECVKLINSIRPEWQQRKLIKNAEYRRIERRCAEIRKMPRYARWRNDVLETCGYKCEVCEETKKLEVHHRQSLYSIAKHNKLADKPLAQSIDCDELWSISNGSVLCKLHHEEMESSQQRKELETKT